MDDIGTILDNIKNLNGVDILVRVLNRKDVQAFIIRLNTDQLSVGLDSTNDIFGLYRSVSYASFKQSLPGRKATTGVVDLRLSGDYYRSFVIDVLKNGDFIIDSDSIKDETDLIAKYGKDIEGLTEDSFSLFIDFILPLFIDETEIDIFK